NVISGSGGIVLQGTGTTLTLGAVNTYAGTTVVGANTIVQGVANALPTKSLIVLGTATGAGTIDLKGFNGGLGGGTAINPSLANTITNSATNTVNLTLTGSGAITNVNVPITGPINLVVTGIGKEILSAANTYTGSTTITGSTLQANNPAALPSGGAL